MILYIPTWITIILLMLVSFWAGTQYVAWKKDPKAFWKEWFD